MTSIDDCRIKDIEDAFNKIYYSIAYLHISKEDCEIFLKDLQTFENSFLTKIKKKVKTLGRPLGRKDSKERPKGGYYNGWQKRKNKLK